MRPRVVIIGGGFGGLWAAKRLAKAPVDVLLLDRRNHHVFSPLLYQVATAGLSPGDIASPIRWVLRDQSNLNVWLADATAIDVPGRVVRLTDGEVPYDYLIVAAGSKPAYFGHDDWATHARGLKTMEDAIAMRQQVLVAFDDKRILTYIWDTTAPKGAMQSASSIPFVMMSYWTFIRRGRAFSTYATPRLKSENSSSGSPPMNSTSTRS